MGTKQQYDNFINIPLVAGNLTRYPVRTSILTAVNQALPKLGGHLIDVGCGKMPYRQYMLNNSDLTKYTGLDIETALVYDQEVQPDFTWDGITMPFDDETFDCAMATEVFEHCPDVDIILNETYRVLKPGGKLFFTVPFLFYLHEVPHDEYRYTPFSLKRHFNNAGFEGEIKSLGGWHAAMAQMLGAWIEKGPISKRNKKLLSFIAVPIMKKLLAKDIKPELFLEGDMITGLHGVVIKATK